MNDVASRTLTYKFQRLREAIREAIEAGEYRGKLPGERELARRFSANAKTISKALSDLTGEGLLIRQVGRGTFIADQNQSAGHPARTQKFRWITTNGSNHVDQHRMYELAAEIIHRGGHQIRLQSVAPNEAGELPEGCFTPGELRDVDGLIVWATNPSFGLAADWMRRRIPVVLANCRGGSVKVNAVIPDYARGAFELGMHLAELGHQRIGLAINRENPTAGNDAQRGYLTALRRHGFAVGEVVRCTEQTVGQMLDVSPQPSAWICCGAVPAASFKRAAIDRGRWASQPISLTVLAEPGQDVQVSQSLTSYDFDTERMLQWMVRVLMDSAPGVPASEVIVPGRFVDRGSTAPFGPRGLDNHQPIEATL